MVRRFVVLFTVGCLLSAARMPAQSYTHLSGLILDPSDAAVPGATVSVVNRDTGFRWETRSRSDGSYIVVSLEPGQYKITVRKPGFRTLIRLGVGLDAGQPARVDFTLPLGSMQESITVEGAPPMLCMEDASAGTLIGRDQIERLSSNGHTFTSLLEFAPGTITTPATRGEPGQFTTDGQRPNTNAFSLDGVSVNTGVSAGGLPAQTTGGSLPAMTALGTLHSVVSSEAINEFRVQTSSTAPDFGRLPGAQIMLSSRSGSNEFHGSVFDYVRNEALDANNWFANRQGNGRSPARMENFGSSLGGPAKRNRTFFFLSYEGMRVQQPFPWLAPVPDASMRLDAPGWARPLLNLFPFPNGPSLGSGLAEWTGQSSRPSRFDTGSARIDHTLTSHITLFGRYNQTPSWSEFNATQVNRISIDSRSLTVGANVRLKQSVVVDLRMNASQAKLHSSWLAGSSPCDLQPVVSSFLAGQDACDYLLRFSIAGVGQVVAGSEGIQSQDQWQTAANAVVSHGTHQIRLGGDSLQLTPARHDTNPSFGLITQNLEDMLNTRNLWTAVSTPQNRRSVLAEDSLFVQDTWRIHPQLTLSLGLRWEFAAPPELKVLSGSSANPFLPAPDRFSPPPLYLFSGQASVWPRTYTNLAPRFGLAFRPSAESRTVFRAGWGIYYDSSLSIGTDLVNGGPFTLSQYQSAMHAPFPTLLSYGFMPGLRLPAVRQRSATVEHAFGGRQLVSVVYEGSAGRQLLRREIALQDVESFWLALATNNGLSSYDALQFQYRLTGSHGFSGLASYAWAHSIDNSSSDSELQWVGPGLNAARDRGSSDFDVRHSFVADISYEPPRKHSGPFSSWLLNGWGLDGIVRARTGFPITVLNADYSMGLSFANVFRPDLVPGQPVWLSDPSAPGGRRLNSAAFQEAPGLIQGELGRNAIAGFGMYQIDFALRRDFAVAERRSFQFRIEAFNALNHPNFADPLRYLSSPLFGQANSMLNMMLGTGSPGSGMAPLFQNGGARSLQVMMRFRF
ncbi:MAG TPA: carboxypeptidase-like regulatory domain-containing protein [Bryobacteraceae bacterium]|nr:carboxypeptidase-like regulatory domain-containing protein [Bryobacteraceae bacterium]